MQKIISGHDVKPLDQAYIRDQGITSFNLMERAASTFCKWFEGQTRFRDSSISVFCGTGNNGGDGLAVSRMLFLKGYNLRVFYLGNLETASPDFTANYRKLPAGLVPEKLEAPISAALQTDIIIDALFGVGLNRPIGGLYLELTTSINQHKALKISIDLPSGMPADEMVEGAAVFADYTFTFQFPKLSLLFPDHAPYTGELIVGDIGIPETYFFSFSGSVYYVQEQDLPGRHKRFNRFSHKSSFGKVMLVGGSRGKIGAICLSSRAALRTGSGLVVCFLPKCGMDIVQTAVPEVMVEASTGEFVLEPGGLGELDRFDALGMGPGLGTGEGALASLEFVLNHFQKAMVLDADALNLLSMNKHLLPLLRSNIILTPHLKEFERLVGSCKNHLERMEKARSFCKTYSCILVLKGANTLITLPEGQQFFNSTGTVYMATGGAGDVLTGMIASFLGQGYSPENSAICGVYHHGLAGEIASVDKRRGCIASDILENVPRTFVKLNID